MNEFVAGNRISLLRSGSEYFPALEAAIDGARLQIHLETYIFEADETGRAIAAALSRAAARGVVTHVLIDGFGSKNLDPEVINDMRVVWRVHIVDHVDTTDKGQLTVDNHQLSMQPTQTLPFESPGRNLRTEFK